MPTQMRTIRMDNDDWKALLRIARANGYEDRAGLIRAIARGEVELYPRVEVVHAPHPAVQYPTLTDRPFPEEEQPPTKDPSYEKDFDWGA